MSFALGTAVGRIVLDYDGSGVADAEKDVEGLKKSSGGTAKALGTVSTAAGVAGLAIAGGLAVAVNTAASFEQRMSAISAVSGATGKELDGLRDKALQLGKDTSFSASESAAAMEELVKAGISTKDVLNGAADATVALAAAGEVALPEAATIASNAMNQFGLAAKDLPGVADQIAGAANASAIDVSDFGQSLTQVGAVANLAGVSFEDTATAIALMGNAGIKGSDAGTSLKSMFARLQPTTTKQIKLFKELGLTTKEGNNAFYDAKGNLKSLSDVSGILQGSLKGMTKEQKQATLNTLFGSDAIRAAAILSNNGAKGFDKMSKSIAKTKAADVAKTRLDNFNGSMEQMKGSLETAGIAVGTALLPMLRQLVDGLTQVANWFNNLSDSQKQWVAGGAAAAAALLLIVAGVVKFVLFAQKMYQALIVLRAAMASTWLAALGPIALIIAAIALVVAIIILLWKKNETFRKIVLATWSAIKAAALAVASWFSGPFVDFFVKAWDMIVAAFMWAVNFLKSNWKTILLIAILGPLGIVIALIIHFWAQIKAVFVAAGKAIVAALKATWNLIKAVVRSGIGLVVAVVRAYLNTLRAIWTAIWNGIKAVVRAVWAAIRGIVSAYIRGVVAIITGAWNTARAVTQRIWNALLEIIRSVVNRVGEVVGTIKDKVLGALSGAGSWLYSKGQEIVQGLIDGIGSMAGALKDKAASVLKGGIGKLIPGSPVAEGPLTVLNNGYAGRKMIEMVIDGIEGQRLNLERASSGVMGTIPTSAVAPKPGGGRLTKGKGGAGQSKMMEIKGDLTLTKEGKAVLTGIAVGIVDDDDDFDDTLGRMG